MLFVLLRVSMCLCLQSEGASTSAQVCQELEEFSMQGTSSTLKAALAKAALDNVLSRKAALCMLTC